MKTTVHKPYFWKQFESKYSLLDGFVHFSTFRLTLSELVLSVQHSHCLKIQCSEPFLSAGSVIYPRQQSIPLFKPTEIRFGGTVGRNKPTWSSVSTGTFPPQPFALLLDQTSPFAPKDGKMHPFNQDSIQPSISLQLTV